MIRDFGVFGGFNGIFVIMLVWTLAWKGFALWISARENKKWWFIPLLIINTVGIFEIIYIFGFSGWGRSCIRDFMHKKNSNSEQKKECDCTSCEGCECECHKPVKED